MKRIKYLLIMFVLLFIGIANSKAITCDDINEQKMITAGEQINSGITLNGINYYGYKFKYNGLKFASYCKNAGAATGFTFNSSYNGNITVSCKRELMNFDQETDQKRIYDAGLLYILTNGYDYQNQSGSLDALYVATNTAIRVYEVFFAVEDDNTNTSRANHIAHRTIAKEFLTNSQYTDIQKAIKELKKNYAEYGSNLINDSIGDPVYSAEMVFSDSSIKPKVAELVLGALNAANDYAVNGGAKITNTTISTSRKASSSGGSSAIIVTQSFTLKIEKFNHADSKIEAKLECDNCTSIGAVPKLYINDVEMPNGTIDIMRDYVKDGNATLKVKIVTTINSTSNNCGTIKPTLHIVYNDESINSQAFELFSGYYNSSQIGGSVQSFFLLFDDNIDREKDVYKSVSVCPSCLVAEDKCLNHNDQSACDVYNNYYGGSCSSCVSLTKLPVCSNTETEMDIIEGTAYKDSSCEVDDKPNILSCVINRSDVNGNSYEAKEILNNNKYCSVWCKEDYHITLPGVQAVNSGRYFTLQASINGKKVCYTNKINKTQFEIDYEEAREDLIDAWNEWSKYYAYVNTNFEYVGEVGNTYRSGETYTGTCHGRNSDGTTYSYDCTKCRYVSSDDCFTSQYKKSGSYKTYDKNGRLTVVPFTEYYGKATGHSSRCSDGWCSKTTYMEEYNSKGYEGLLSRATSALNQAITKFNNIVKEYNKCSSWTMNYKYDPELSFWYEESYMNDVINNKLDTVGSTSSSSVSKSWCKYTGSTSDTNYQGTNSSYETCNGGSFSGSELMATSESEDGLSRFVCNNTSCYTATDIKIQQSVRVKAEMTASGSYITPTQFYRIAPTGTVVVAEPGKENNIENSKEETNKLLVGLGTHNGVYNYSLMIKDLGEYYGATPVKLGRIWGNVPSVVTGTLEDDCHVDNPNDFISSITTSSINGTQNDNSNTATGVYVCAYKVNCPDCPIYCDEDGCEQEGCSDNLCPITCDNCIISNDKPNISYRPIASGNVNPNNRDLGKNWQFNESSIKTALELKAYTTTKEIVENGEEIYDSTNDEYVMKVTMDSSLMAAIRQYNEDHGDYLNNTLKCYDSGSYKNIFCYSTFIDEMLASHRGNFTINKNRPSDEASRRDSENSNYWTTWTKAVAAKTWNITTVQSVAITTAYDNDIGIGPSWK